MRDHRLKQPTSLAASAFKDSVLNGLADTCNVAQFISFGPDLLRRHVRVGQYPTDFRFRSLEDACATLLSHAPSHSINVRSFKPGEFHSDFHYGIGNSDSGATIVRSLAERGLYTIVNETIDVNDGGISGVYSNDVVEFAPGDTPRCVERPGTASLPSKAAFRLLQTVYGFAPALGFGPNQRIEFSIHPTKQGLRRDHTIVWELSPESSLFTSRAFRWPNRFSRFIGDKAYGLLVGWVFGLPVPRTTVISRSVPPFTFGRPTGSGECWLRTCPVEQEPGRFTSLLGWRDPFELLSQEDPSGTLLASVLSQEGVEAAYSGAAITGESGRTIVEGVKGSGVYFMVGKVAPLRLPKAVTNSVLKLYAQASVHFGPVRFEWVNDGRKSWLVQLHHGETSTSEIVICPGKVSEFVQFETKRGIEELRRLVATMSSSDMGIELIGDIGVTSHMGDLLRKAGIVSNVRQSVVAVQIGIDFVS